MSTENPAPTPTETPAPPPTPAVPPAPAQEPPKVDETDWKAEARKHEARAKEYKVGHDKAAAIEAASLTETQRLTARAESAETENAGFKAAAQIATWKAEVSKDSGVPEAALSGSTLEALQAHAAVLKPLITKADPPVDDGKPHVPYRDLSKVLADAPSFTSGRDTLRRAHATKQ